MGPVGLGVQPSVPAASQAPAAQLGISDPAMYDKWRQVAWRVAAELGREAELPPLGPGSRAKLLDGHPLAASDPRLEALRHPWAASWPGQILVGLAQQRMLAPEVVLWEAGHTQAQSWLRPVLPWVEPDDLWSAERHCGTGDLLRGLAARGGCCVVRQHGPLQGSLGGVRQSQGAIDPGKVYDHGDPLRLRRIPGALQEPTRDGDTASPVLSHVPLRKASAQQLAERDGKRWTLDTMLQEVTETLPCAVNALGSPQAALLGLCLALMASQAVAVMQAAWRAVHGHETVHQDISASSLA